MSAPGRRMLLAMAMLAMLGACPSEAPEVEEGISPDEDQARSILAVAPEETLEGATLYERYCMACHQADGGGAGDGTIPALAPNPLVTLDDPEGVITTVLGGRAGMPSFSWLSDEELAAILTHLRQLGENDSGPVEPEQVGEARA